MSDPLKVLLVDDEADFLDSLARLLVRRGILVATAGDGAAAIQMAAREDFDAIILDLRMPGMDGLTVLKTLRRSDPLTPMLLLSGEGDVSAVREAMQEGAVDFFFKPCRVEVLLAAIEDAGEKKRYARRLGKLEQ